MVGFWDQQQHLYKQQQHEQQQQQYNNKSNVLFTDPILTKLLMEGFWDKTTTK